MIIKATKKPVTIEAIQWTGENKKEVADFIGNNGSVKGQYVDIGTSKGLRVASVDDYIIKDIQGNHYPCKSDIFKTTYDFKEKE